MNCLQLLYKSACLKLVIDEDIVEFYLIVYNDPYTEKSDADYLVDTLEEAFEKAEKDLVLQESNGFQ